MLDSIRQMRVSDTNTGKPFTATSNHSPDRVLVVDDLATNRAMVKALLQPLEFNVLEAADGEEALGLLATHEVDAVLLDIMMPGIDGYETCRRIRNDLHLELLPVIMLTALGDTDNVVAGMDAGATDYVSKPFNSIELAARIKAAIDHKHLTDRLDDTESVLFALARMVEAKDETTGDHCDRLSHMTQVFGKSLGLAYDELEHLRRGGVLHDIGKLGIPDSILLKEGKLDDDEWVIMRQHTVIGEQLCSSLKTMRGTVSIIRSHHEKWNGSGYPDGLHREEIPLLARIFQIVDVYDALTSERPYKKAFSNEKAMAILAEEASKGFWDPELIAEFLNIVRTRPVDLQIPKEQIGIDRSALIFDSIINTGVLDWDKKPRTSA